ncbi:putative metalloprotease CJM1_0395 family protein [Nitrococcus mobilis]|nr:putative metalloprotease CJM1_0395 family protein [Nitrococcus mobilis]
MISTISSTPIPTTAYTATPTRGNSVQHTATERDAAQTETAARIRELRATDRRVRAHEAAHLAAAGALARSGANFTMVRGPDGRSYAVGGEVSLDVSPGRSPEETLAKAQQIRAAALAPADPSTQDFAVAAQAAQMAQQAQQEATAGGASETITERGTHEKIASALADFETREPAGTRIDLFS